MKYELSEEQLNNLKVFLLRVDLKGSEAIAFCEIINTLQKPLPEE